MIKIRHKYENLRTILLFFSIKLAIRNQKTLLICLTLVKQIFRSRFHGKTSEKSAANAVFSAPLKKSKKNLKKSYF